MFDDPNWRLWSSFFLQEQAREIIDGDYLRQQREEDERGITSVRVPSECIFGFDLVLTCHPNHLYIFAMISKLKL